MANSVILARDSVHKQLGRIASVSGKPSTAPILGHALIEHEGDNIRVTGTDMDIWLSVTVPAEGKRFAPLAIPAQDLHDVIAALPAGAQLEISWKSEDATSVKIKSGRSRFTLPIMAASEFPATPRADDCVEFTVAAGIFNAMIDRSRWAVSKEETRYYLNGVFLHVANDRLVCIATNGHLLGRAEGPLPEGAEGLNDLGEGGTDGGIILPTASIKLIASIIGDTDADVDIRASKGHFQLERKDDDSTWSLTTRLIDGTFPDYTKVVPELSALAAGDVEASVLSAALARVALLAPEANTIKLEASKGVLRISTTGPDGREAEEEIDAAWASTKAIQPLGFSAKYLKAVLDGIAADTVVLALTPTADGPCILMPRGRSDTFGVIMPVRV